MGWQASGAARRKPAFGILMLALTAMFHRTHRQFSFAGGWSVLERRRQLRLLCGQSFQGRDLQQYGNNLAAADDFKVLVLRTEVKQAGACLSQGETGSLGGDASSARRAGNAARKSIRLPPGITGYQHQAVGLGARGRAQPGSNSACPAYRPSRRITY